MNLIARPQYLKTLKHFKDTDVIKVVTGIRRCGKSTLFSLYIDYLLKQGVNKEQIIRLNLEDGSLYDIKDYRQLYEYINAKLLPNQRNYVFVDEVQQVFQFQKAIDSLYIKENCDVYITGSNAYLLSGELATLLSGRYVEIKMLPLSFKEYISSTGNKHNLLQQYNDYLLNSSFPYARKLPTRQDVLTYLDGLYNTVLVKDIATRKQINNMATLQRVLEFLFDNIGNISTATKIANTLASGGYKISVMTVESYLQSFLESYIFYKAERYDVKGKNRLTTGAKYYAVDLGFWYYLFGQKKADLGHLLENVVYLELIRRGFKVFVGKVNTNEIDFMAENQEGVTYYQIAYSVLDEQVLQRELKSLAAIDDHHPKYLLTMDVVPPVNHNGIRQLNVLDWLLEEI